MIKYLNERMFYNYMLNKRGYLDARILLVIIAIILIYLYFKSKGYNWFW